MSNGLLFHVRANPLVGTGRLLRSLKLARQWIADGGKSIFVSGQLPAILLRQIAISGCEIVRTDHRIGAANLARFLCSTAQEQGCPWIVTDETSPELIRNVMARKLPGQHLLVFGNSDSAPCTQVDLATGSEPAYALVRDHGGKISPPRNANRRKPPRCLMDLSRMNGRESAELIRLVCKTFTESEIVFDIVTPFSFSAADQLCQQKAGIRERMFWHRNPDRVTNTLNAFDLAVMTDAASFYETAYCQLPSLYIADGGFPYSGMLDEMTRRPCLFNRNDTGWAKDICQAIAELLGSPTSLARHASDMSRLVDGQGAVRLCQTMRRKITGQSDQVRSA